MNDRSLRERFSSILPRERILDDALSLTAVATDASFYQIKPLIILDVLTHDEMLAVLEICARDQLPVTYRAAGTSLSGQALGEGVLIRIARGWRKIRLLDEGARIALEPGVIGAQANRALKVYQRKIGPDPATIQNAMIGGIAANNSSGMCCGTDQNTYRTMDEMKLILMPSVDGQAVSLDTGSLNSKTLFRKKYPALLGTLSELRKEIFAQPELLALIQKKYKIKNTMGYALNSFIDHEDPIDMLSHLMIGSEGTLGFISEITYRTVPDYRYRSCALLFFETLGDACRAATRFKSLPIAAAELMDRTSLRRVEDKPGMPVVLRTLGPEVCALLIETRAETPAALDAQINEVMQNISEMKLAMPPEFSSDPLVFEVWWNIRRGLFPSVGRGRTPGTTVIIEDVAFPIENLAPAAEDLKALLARHGYPEAILFGHVLDGNFHFCFAQDFNSPAEVERYAGLMSDLGDLVAHKWQGSLKAEHGTGRNMAPFVELEWGTAAYSLMKRLKAAIDPLGVFNPGVMLNASATVHLEALKTTPQVDSMIDECIECGFCEAHCPSLDLTVTPRQRIAAFREFERTKDPAYESLMQYPVEETCAADGLCAVACPVSIDTGAFIKKYRARKRSFDRVAAFIARYFSLVLHFVHLGLRFLSLFDRVMPRAARFKKGATHEFDQKVVYLPSCISRTMGPARIDSSTRSLPEVMHSLFKKSRIEVIYPENLSSACCGLPFESKGFPVQGDQKSNELNEALLKASRNGLYDIICDTSPCTQHLQKKLDPRLRVKDSVEFMHELVLSSALKINPVQESVAVHVTCSAVHMGLSQKLIAVTKACSSNVLVPEEVGCCGFAGDKGFTHPELTRSALAKLAPQVKGHCSRGFSNSRTCEIGLSRESEVSYQSIAYLLDQVSE